MLIIISLFWRNIYLQRTMFPSVVLIVCAGWLTLTNAYAYRADRHTARLIVYPALLAAILMGYQSPRRDIRPALVQACNGADVVFNTSVENQFFTAYLLPNVESVLWEHARVYRNQSIGDKALHVFGWRRAALEDLSGQTVCVMDSQYPHARPAERLYFASEVRPLAQSTRVLWDGTPSAYMRVLEVIP